jgi:hypothetical protein
MRAVREKKCGVSAEITVILKSLSFLMCLAAVIPETPFPMITTCFIQKILPAFFLSAFEIKLKIKPAQGANYAVLGRFYFYLKGA